MESRKDGRQPVGGDGLAGDEAQRAPLQPAKLLQHRLGRVGPRKNSASLGQEQPSGLCQSDAAPDAVEELGCVSLLKRGDGCGSL
ncbi:hypothetical protein ABIC16_004219 [Sphingomonas sp. PvP055]